MLLMADDVSTAGEPLDARSFGEFIRAHDQQLRGVAWAVVRDQHQTDDIMQAAYEKAFRNLPNFDGRSSLSTWMHSIVYRTAIDHVRYEGRRRHDDVDDLRNTGQAGTDAGSVGVDRLEFEAAMERLSPEERTVLMLVAGLGYSYDETALIIGEARGTVASRVSRARSRLERWQA
jgi:RNA polymerase sigma-70 factor (ECF subfamily)